MNSTVMVERTGMGMPGVGVPGVGGPGVGSAAGTQATANWLMVPRCQLRFEKTQGGMKVNCICDDKMACSMLQNLCQMLQGGMCSVCVQLNGMTVCTCNLTMGLCRCELTDTGVSVTCTSGDNKCCEVIQAYCDCLNTQMNAGCTCCVLLNNTPICCGVSEAGQGAGKSSGKK